MIAFTFITLVCGAANKKRPSETNRTRDALRQPELRPHSTAGDCGLYFSRHAQQEGSTTMPYRYLRTERADNVVTCVLSNPPRHTLTSEGVSEINLMLDEVEEDQSVRALVFTSDAEDVFIAHYEVTELASRAGEVSKKLTNLKPREDQPRGLSPMHKLCLRLESMAAITIAAINGSTTGGGFELSLACDFRLLASGRYRVGLPETSIGIIPGAGGTQRYARLLGTAKALDLIMHAKLLTPEQALDIGLVHRVFPRDTFHEAAKAFAEDIASRSPVALSAAKRAIQIGSRMTLEDALLLEQECFEKTMRSKDAAAAMEAYLGGSKTPYNWQGH